MMDNSLRGLLLLVRSSLMCEPAKLPEGFSMEQICELALKHQIETMAYDGAIYCGISKREEAMKKLFQYYVKALVKSEKQVESLHQLYKAFDEVGIDYLPLKGCVMKPMYPKAELRAMNDADILIKVEQYEKISPILENLNYRFLAESDCELKWVSAGLYLELHKRLIPSFIKDFYAYFGDGWQLAADCVGSRYAMSKEDEFLFLFTHFARHYREGGVGIRHMADIWFYRIKHPSMDEKKIVDVLKSLSLDTFYENILKTLENWFENGEETAITCRITDYIASSGSFGTAETKVVAAGASAGSKGRNIVSLIFPSVRNMRYAYPVLQKCPALLPVMWVYRWFRVVFFRRDKIKVHQERLKIMENEKLSEFEENMRAVGINTNFEEN